MPSREPAPFALPRESYAKWQRQGQFWAPLLLASLSRACPGQLGALLQPPVQAEMAEVPALGDWPSSAGWWEGAGSVAWGWRGGLHLQASPF